MLINIIASILVIIICGYFCYKNYKKCESNLEKLAYVMLFITFLIPFCIYYLDRYNIPSILKWNKNVDTQNWLSFLATYFASVIGAFIGAIVLIIVTIMQIRQNNEDILKRDKVQMRINNMPLLKYDFVEEISGFKAYIIETINKTGKDGYITLNVKNIGMNTAKSMQIKLIGKETINNKFQIDFELFEKDETKIVPICIKKLKFGNNELSFKIIYQDLLNNWYCQNIKLNINVKEQEMSLLKKVEDAHFRSRKP